MNTIKLNPAHVVVIYKGETMENVVGCTVVIDENEIETDLVREAVRKFDLDPMILDVMGAGGQWFERNGDFWGDKWAHRYAQLLGWCATRYATRNPLERAHALITQRGKQLGYALDYNLDGDRNPYWTKIPD